MTSLSDIRQKYPGYSDMSDEQLAQKFHAKFYSDMPFEQFAQKVGYTPTEQPPAQDGQDMSLGHQLLGNAELAGGAIANIPHALAHAATDIYHRVTGDYSGQDPSWVQALHVQPGQAGQDLSKALSGDLEQTIDNAGGGGAAEAGAGAVNSGIEAVDQHAPFVSKVVAPIAGDVAMLAGARAPLQAAGGKVAGAVGEALAPATEYEGGFRSGGNQPVARTVAGKSGQQALQIHNQQLGDTIAAGEANHPPGEMSYESLNDAQQGPNSAYTRIAAAMPEGAVDDIAQQQVAGAGGGRNKLVTSSDASQKQIASMKAQLSQPMTGQELMDNMRSLRQEGFKRAASEDVDQQAIGRAQLDMARALEGHVERNLPQGGDVTLSDFKAARKALAKNYTVQGALRGSNVDLQAIARIQRADPALLDGGLKAIADFANGPGRSVTHLPNTYDKPSFAADAAQAIDLEKPIQGISRFLGGAAARSRLTGDTATAVQNAVSRFGAQPGRFNPRPGLTPPPGTAGRTPAQMSLGDLPQGPGPSPFTLGDGANPNPPPSGGNPGDIPLADMLSHGVEQSPPAGLSVGPMGSPPPQGVPFTRNVVHEAGDLQMAPEDSWFKGAPQGLGDDLAGVMSQGVPEGTVARAPKRRFVADTVEFPGGAPRRQVLENNASGESAASLEAQRRLANERSTGSAPFMIDPEGLPKAVAHTTDAVDVTAPKGHLKVQLDPTTGKLSIMDRGGLTAQAARGLLNRYLTLHGPTLGDVF